LRRCRVVDHEADKPETLVKISDEPPVSINRIYADADLKIVQARSGTPAAFNSARISVINSSFGTGRVMSLIVMTTDSGCLLAAIAWSPSVPIGARSASRTAPAGSASLGMTGPVKTSADPGTRSDSRPPPNRIGTSRLLMNMQ